MTQNKLQIRAAVMQLIQELHSVKDVSKEKMDDCLNELNNIGNLNYVLELLLRELINTDFKTGEIIAYFIIQLGNLEGLKDVLWEYIRDSRIQDDKKELICVILRGLGDSTNPQEYFMYVENAQEIIDKETQKLLETAIVNPEAQIDFLDFFFTLGEKEQLDLFSSLKSDFESQYVVNILIPALYYTQSLKIKEEIIEVLGNTKSQFAVLPLQNVLNYEEDEKIKKLAKKNLNLLKISGIDTEANIERGEPLCNITSLHECYCNYIDGAGSQGFIISRLRDNQDILMFSVVVNDVDGIIDSFGFHGITKNDFKKILDRFDEDRIKVSPEYCKSKLQKIELINLKNNIPISYEYSAWKALMFDFPEKEPELNAAKINSELSKKAGILYDSGQFKHWFLDKDDSENFYKLLYEILDYIVKDKDKHLQDSSRLIEFLDEKVNDIIPKVFIEPTRKIFSKRLYENAYLLNVANKKDLSDIVFAVADEVNPDNGLAVENSIFINKLSKKSVREFLKMYNYKPEEENSTVVKQLWGENKQENEKKVDISAIIEILEDKWN